MSSMKSYLDDSAPLTWHGTGIGAFAWIGAYSITRRSDERVDIYEDIDGDDVRVATVNSESEAVAYIVEAAS